jgi:hypothetical protein
MPVPINEEHDKNFLVARESPDPVFQSHRRRGAEAIGETNKNMNDSKHSQNAREKSHGENSHQGPRPYWKYAHRDWRIWFFVILMLAAMAIYLMTGDLRWPLHAPAQPMVPATG